MSTLVSPFPVFRALDSTGKPLAGGKLYTYVAGTSTAQATYTDASGGQANTNPVVLDAAGQANVWLLRSAYKFVLKDANDVTQWTVDNINVTPSKVVDVEDYGAVGNGVTDDSAAFIAAATAAGTWGTVMVKRPSVSYNIGSNVPNSVFWMIMGGAQISGIGTLTGIQIAMKSAGELSIVSPTGTNTLSIDTSNNWVLNGASFDLAGGHTTINGGALVISESNYGAAIDPGTSAKGKLVFYSGYGTPALDYNVSSAYNLSWNDSHFSNAFRFGSSLDVPRMGGASFCNTYGYFQTCNFTYDGETYAPTTNGDIFGQGVLSLGDPYLTASAGLIADYTGIFLRCSNSVTVSPKISFNNGRNSTGVFPTYEYQIGAGQSLLGQGEPDSFFIARRLDSANVSTAVTIDYNGCFGIGCHVARGIYGTAGGKGLTVVGDSSTTTNQPLVVYDIAAGSTSYAAVTFKRNGTTVGTITETSSNTAYNTSSDYRLKENLAPTADALDKVNSVQMYAGNYKAEPDVKFDFALAHEVQAVLPYAVQGVKDGVEMQQLDYSKLVPVLWAAVQQLSKEVDDLKKELGK